MIYTVTLNPAIDYVVKVAEFRLGETNRSYEEGIYFGGKGINVSLVLKALGVDSTALGFVAGETGELFCAGITKQGLTTDFIRVANGRTRINVKLKEEKESEINATGPQVSPAEQEQLLQQLSSVTAVDTVVLAGSLPKGLPQHFYEIVMRRLAHTGARIVVDTTGQALRKVLPYHPFLIKPNLAELSELVGQPLATEEEIAHAAHALQQDGALNVMVSLGGQGLLLFDEYGAVHRAAAHRGAVVNTVGAGDSTVAGFVYSTMKGLPYEQCVRFANACGGATAFGEGLATRAAIAELYGGIV